MPPLRDLLRRLLRRPAAPPLAAPIGFYGRWKPEPPPPVLDANTIRQSTWTPYGGDRRPIPDERYARNVASMLTRNITDRARFGLSTPAPRTDWPRPSSTR